MYVSINGYTCILFSFVFRTFLLCTCYLYDVIRILYAIEKLLNKQLEKKGAHKSWGLPIESKLSLLFVFGPGDIVVTEEAFNSLK